MGRASDSAQVLAIALITYSDDEGFFWLDAAQIRGELRPYWTLSKVRKTIAELISVGWISARKPREISENASDLRATDARFAQKLGEIEIGRLPKFLEHQVVSHPKPSKIRPFWPVDSMNVPGTLQDASHQRGEEGRGREGKGEEAAPAPPAGTSPARSNDAPPGDLFFIWFQDQREADGHVRENPPKQLHDLDALWRTMSAKLGAQVDQRARAAAKHFITETKAKGAPWAWFAKQWERYASKGYGQTPAKGAAPESDWSGYREGDTMRGLGGGG